MKKYNVKVEKIKTTEFELEAKNKKEAKKMVEDTIYNSQIFDLPTVNYNNSYNFIIKKKRG